MISLNEAADFLSRHDDIAILTHQFPDGDTLGSATALCTALQTMGKRACVRSADPIGPKYAYLCAGIRPEEFAPKAVVSVDVADFDLLGEKLKEEFRGRIDLAIDHHVSHTPFAKATYVDSRAAATTEVIYLLITKLGVRITPQIAACIYTGITTDTGCFRYPNATPRTYRIAAVMMDAGVDAADINRLMFDTKSRARLEIERRVMDSLTFCFDDRCAVIYITRRMIEESGAREDDMDGLSALPRQVEGVLVGITIREKKNGDFKISLRTQPPIHAAQICEEFGGGGHAGAAGCTMSGSVEEVRERIVAAAGRRLPKE